MLKTLAITLFFTINAGLARAYIFPKDIEYALRKAGSNRPELEKFLLYCKKSGDPLKMKAAYFLIKNMDIHYSMDYYWENSTGIRVPFSEFDYPNLTTATSAFDKLIAKDPSIHPHPIKMDDLTSIKGDYLIENLNDAFLSWRRSAYRNISFNDFCEFILPYRTSIEPLQAWRSPYSKEFTVFTQAYQHNGLNFGLEYLSGYLKSWFINTFSWGKSKEPLPRLGAKQLLFRKKGACEDIADLVTFATRATGIPSAVNYVPYWATSTDSHFFNTVFDKVMKPVPFDALAGHLAANYTLAREPSKVLQLTYSKQKMTLAVNENSKNIPPGFLRTSNYIDVTPNFWPCTDVSCQLFVGIATSKYAFACVFNGLIWHPTWWGTIKDGKTVFKNMPRGVIYMPAIYVKNQLVPAGYPVAQGYHHEQILQPDLKQVSNVTVKEDGKHLIYQPGAVYSLYYWGNKWLLCERKAAAVGTHELTFANAPKNALFLLMPNHIERQERPFLVMNDQNILWF